MSVFSENETGAPSLSLAGGSAMQPSPETESLSIADATSLVEYSGLLSPNDAEGEAHDSALAAQWIRQLVACYSTEGRVNLANPITPNTLIPVIYWSTSSTPDRAKENIDLVPLWMLAQGEDAFRKPYSSPPQGRVDPMTTQLGNEHAPYSWHITLFWGDAESDKALTENTREHLKKVVSPNVLKALEGFNDALLDAIKKGMPQAYKGLDSLDVDVDVDVDMGCGLLEQTPGQGSMDALPRSGRYGRDASVISLKPISLLANGIRFQPHKFADQWLAQWNLTGAAQVQVTYHEVETVDSAAERKTTSAPLRAAVTQGFLTAYQSRTISTPAALSPREGWVYPHRSHMSLDFSSLRVNGRALSQDLLRQLQAGIPPGYQGTGRPVITEVDAQGSLVSAQEKEQIKQLALLDANQVKLDHLFAGLPMFDTVIKNLLVNTIKAKIPGRKFRASMLENIDPDNGYVNHFTTDSNGGRSLTSSESFTDIMWGCLLTDSPPRYTGGGVGFFTRPDAVDEADSVFSSPVDMQILRAMESAFYIANPTTSDRVRRQFRDDLITFRNNKNWGGSLDTSTPSTAEAAFAHLLSRRFLHLFDLYKADRNPVNQLTQSARTQQADEDRLLDIITTHPSMADRNRLLRAPIPHVYVVMLDMGTVTPQKWPAAMVIKRTDRQLLFLYSLEGGIQRFRSFQDLVSKVRPTYEGKKRTIRDISSELSGHVFEVAAEDLLRMQSVALETALTAPGNETVAVRTFAQNAENMLGLPMLSLAGPLAARQETRVENNRPNFYKTATLSEQANYRRLEEQVFQAVYKLGGGIQTLLQFIHQKVKQYLQQTVHPGIDPDPDKTMVTLSYGKSANPGQSRITSLTQLMLDNIRPHQYPNAMREVLTVYLADQHGQRIRHPANGFLINLTGSELARMATSIDAGGSYENLLREQMNKPEYKAAWQTAYLANMRFKGYEAALRGDEVFKATMLDKAFNPPKSQKLVARWLDAVLQSPTTETRALVLERRVHVYGLLLGGSVGAGGQHGTMGNAVSIDGALIFSDQDGPDIKGTVGVYFPDSPDGNDFHEFSSLGDGVAGLLQQEEWQAYFRSRISTLDPEEIKRLLGQQRGRPLIRDSLITGDLLEALLRAHVNFNSAYADHRSNSNLDIQRQSIARFVMVAIESVLDMAGLLLVPGFQMLKRAIRTGSWVLRTGIVPLDLNTLVYVDKVANYGGRVVRGMVVPSRGQASFLPVTARQSQGEALAGLPLEEALYRRYTVTDTSPIQGLAPDAQGFYRPNNSVTGSVTRAVYVRQPDGTVFRVHDHTQLKATEATIVDPVTGLNIRYSGVMRSTVARMPNGEWRAVGFGQGGGKRSGDKFPQPGPSKPKVPAQSSPDVSNSIRTPGNWDNQIMDLVPSIMTRLPSWPQNRSLLVIDEISAEHQWSVRFTPGLAETIYPLGNHPDRTSRDIILSRTAQNHYSLILGDRVVQIPADGDCFFNAIARGLNEGQEQETFSMQGLRNEAADYIDQHPEMSQYLAPQVSGMQQAFFENAPALEDFLDEAALFDLSQIIYGASNPHRLFQPALDYLNLHVNRLARTTLTTAREAALPPEILQEIGRLLSARSPASLTPSSAPFSEQERQSMQHFFEDILLRPIEGRQITELLDNKYLLLSNDVIHIMLEYGVTARQLADHHPSRDYYVEYDEATHGHLDEDELEELLDGTYLVDRDDLDDLRGRLELQGRNLDDSDLFNEFIYAEAAEKTVDLLRASLERFPDLLRRANILLSSPIISYHLSGMLYVGELTRWIRNSALSNTRLQIIAEYASTRYDEVLSMESIDIDWMRQFDDRNVQSIVTHQNELTRFLRFLGGAWGDANDVDVPAVARLFRIRDQSISNSRVAIIFRTPGIWYFIKRLPQDQARQIWNELIGPYFSDVNIQVALAQPGALNSVFDFVLALKAGLSAEETRANLIVQNLLSIGQSRAQQYLYNFDFPSNRLGHSRLDFALHLESHMSIPDWVWQYAREGVTPDSLKPFGELKARHSS